MEKKTQCNGDCLSCSPLQRSYCSSQMMYNMQNMMSEIKALLTQKNNSVDNDIIPLNNMNSEETIEENNE